MEVKVKKVTTSVFTEDGDHYTAHWECSFGDNREIVWIKTPRVEGEEADFVSDDMISNGLIQASIDLVNRIIASRLIASKREVAKLKKEIELFGSKPNPLQEIYRGGV